MTPSRPRARGTEYSAGTLLGSPAALGLLPVPQLLYSSACCSVQCFGFFSFSPTPRKEPAGHLTGVRGCSAQGSRFPEPEHLWRPCCSARASHPGGGCYQVLRTPCAPPPCSGLRSTYGVLRPLLFFSLVCRTRPGSGPDREARWQPAVAVHPGTAQYQVERSTGSATKVLSRWGGRLGRHAVYIHIHTPGRVSLW